MSASSFGDKPLALFVLGVNNMFMCKLNEIAGRPISIREALQVYGQAECEAMVDQCYRIDEDCDCIWSPAFGGLGAT